MRKQLMLSTGTICLMLASGLAYAQAPAGKDEPRRTEQSEPTKGAASRSETRTPDRAQERTPERAQGAQERAQGNAPREDNGHAARNATEKQPAAKGGNQPPTTANENTRTPATNNAQSAPSGTSTTQTQVNQGQTNQTQVNQQARISTDKQVRITETLRGERLAPPERGLNISIRVGEEIPPRVRVHRLPPEIVSIEPEFRDYDYFATDDDIVIVEPRTHRIVSQIPRDASRIRAEGTGAAGGGTAMSTANSAGGRAPCQMMRRDRSAQLAALSPCDGGLSAG